MTSYKDIYIASQPLVQGETSNSLRAPKWSYILPEYADYEVCIFQRGTGQTNWKYQRCWFKSIEPTVAMNDGAMRCSSDSSSGKCFSWMTGSNQMNGWWDFLIYEVYIPGRDSQGIYELGTLTWDLLLPADEGDTATVYM